jgi:alkanesulfonate monooxygenase SsuD/methylene tetrahydromethanopterin reductase-like flavin-dependent oxidoreductase (luciferase family)
MSELRRGGDGADPVGDGGSLAVVSQPGHPREAARDDRRALERSDAPADRRTWLFPGEAEAVGVDFATRGRRADEAIDVLRLLWAGDEKGVSFHGEFFSFANLCSFPKPPNARTLPIHVGGSTRAAARRAGLRGDGYFPGGVIGSQERATQIELMRTTAREAGRDADALEYTRWGSIDMSEGDVEAHAVNGTTRLVVGTSALDPQAQREELSAFAERLKLR